MIILGQPSYKIEETYNVKFVEQLRSGYSFRDDNFALLAETKIYMKFYSFIQYGN